LLDKIYFNQPEPEACYGSKWP